MILTFESSICFNIYSTLALLNHSPSSETQGQSVGPGEKARRKFSSAGGRAPGYRLSQDHFQTVKRMLAPDWAQKMLCIIVPNRRTVHDGYYLATVARFVRGILNSLIFTKTWSVQAWIPVVSSSLYFRKSVFSFRIDSILKWRVYIKLKVCWLRTFLWCMSQTSRDLVNSRMYELTKRTQEMLFADWVK